MRHILFALAVATLAAEPAAGADAISGKKAFEKACGECHSVAKKNNTYGPTMFCVVGRKAGATKFKNYAPDFRAAAKGLVWTEDVLFVYLADPERFIGARIGKNIVITNMDKKWPDPAMRRSIIAFLKSACA